MTPEYTVTQAQVGLTAALPVRLRPLHCSSGIDIAPHDHTYYEITFVRDGAALHRTPHYEADVSRGAVVLVAPGAVHAFAAVRNLEVTNLYYLAEWLLDDLPLLWRQPGLVPLFLAPTLFRGLTARHVPQTRLADAPFAACLRELDDIESESARERPSPLYLRSALLKLLVTLSSAFGPQGEIQVSGFRREVWAVLERVEQCLAQTESFSVGELAASLGISSDHLARMFRQATGRTPMDYYQRRRVQLAGRLLLEPERDLADVARALGYCDSAHLCKVFRRHHGRSPRQYRALYGLGGVASG